MLLLMLGPRPVVTPKTPTRAVLLGISCATTTSCFAVGYSFNSAKGNRRRAA